MLDHMVILVLVCEDPPHAVFTVGVPFYIANDVQDIPCVACSLKSKNTFYLMLARGTIRTENDEKKNIK